VAFSTFLTEGPRGNPGSSPLSAGTAFTIWQRTEFEPGVISTFWAFHVSGELDLQGEVGFGTLGSNAHGGVAERTAGGLGTELDDALKGFCGGNATTPLSAVGDTPTVWGRYAFRQLVWPGLADRLAAANDYAHASPNITQLVVGQSPKPFKPLAADVSGRPRRVTVSAPSHVLDRRVGFDVAEKFRVQSLVFIFTISEAGLLASLPLP